MSIRSRLHKLAEPMRAQRAAEDWWMEYTTKLNDQADELQSRITAAVSRLERIRGSDDPQEIARAADDAYGILRNLPGSDA